MELSIYKYEVDMLIAVASFIITKPIGLVPPLLCVFVCVSLSAAIIYSVCLAGLSGRGSLGPADLSNCGIIDVIHQCV